MNVAKHYFKTSNPVTSTPYYNLRLINSVSPCARLLYIELRRLAGLHGYISKSIRELSYFVGKSARQVSRLIRELVSCKLLEIWQHEGFENEYVIPDVYFRHTHDKTVRTFKSKTYKELTVSRPKPNGISLSPRPEPTVPEPTAKPEHLEPEPQKTESGHKSIHNKPAKPVDFQLVKQILDLTGDTKSTRCWIKFVIKAPEQIVQLAIHSLKAALNSEMICHPGKYLVGIIRRIFPEMFTSGQKQPLRASQDKISAPYYPSQPQSEPEIEVDWKMNIGQLKHIQKMLGKMNSRKD